MGQFHWTPGSYLELMRAEVPEFGRLQDETAAATAGVRANAILELGVGTGETARRVLDRHPSAHLVGVDASEAMLGAAREALEGRPATLRLGRIEDPLPPGPFDLAVSALAVHHLDAAAKADLFERLTAVLRPGGRFVLADVVVPPDAADAITPIDPTYDLPDTLEAQLEWLAAAGFKATPTWVHRDLAVVAADYVAA
jgi:tRNA (cmo5U34)-methyltransferase